MAVCSKCCDFPSIRNPRIKGGTQSRNQGTIKDGWVGAWGETGDQGEFVLLLEITSGEFDAEDEC